MLLGEETRWTSSISCVACNSVCPCSWIRRRGPGESGRRSEPAHRLCLPQLHLLPARHRLGIPGEAAVNVPFKVYTTTCGLVPGFHTIPLQFLDQPLAAQSQRLRGSLLILLTPVQGVEEQPFFEGLDRLFQGALWPEG